MAPSDTSHTGKHRPAVDDHLVPPETRYEMHGGELVHVSPAKAPHATRHSKLIALLEAHTGLRFDVACDLLTRISERDERAPDASVFPIERDPDGHRQIEQLAFEVVSTESLQHAGEKAALLIGRGVRRVFAIDVERSRLLEWSAELETWSLLLSSDYIEDPALEVPLPIEALVQTAKTDDAVAEALLRKRNPVIVQRLEASRTEGRTEGRTESKVEAILAVLTARGITLDEATRAEISGERDLQRLDRWIVRAATCSAVAELWLEP